MKKNLMFIGCVLSILILAYVSYQSLFNESVGEVTYSSEKHENISNSPTPSVKAESIKKENSVRLTNNENLNIPILMYHHFDQTSDSSVVVSKDRFKEQMMALHDAGYNTITDEELLNYLSNGEPIPENPILITIDDGYQSNYTIAYPILKELQMKATIYVVVADQEKTPGSIPHLTWDETREMYESGVVDIQSHTYDSHYYVKTNDGKGPALTNRMKDESKAAYIERIKLDLEKSKKTIEEKLNKEVVALAYPYGAHSNEVIKVAKELGYQLGHTVRRGVNGVETDPFRLMRINVVDQMDGDRLIARIEESME
ncbi:polysaccharide deacetylase family protein [Pseudalkalibacillus berkeleyi]|uniref:Polysaccharide deacetylase family protein n=1 Tax=Pseudalkalibacillus berkeleyi TaxID=1069813 RepID=A0ABS9H4S1_9BACL|nr:polysaccharide deacetylase family protein [Pseudalkalibacillus berkeleyi]MCF6138788.1 polysaccharide deacetylase family protein [Pseudalkalibacillus berkeleyi]